MKPSDRQIFSHRLNSIFEYYHKEVSAEITSMYFEDLMDYELEDIWRAFSMHRKNKVNGKFLPKISDLLDYLPSLVKVERRSSRHFLCQISWCMNDGSLSHSTKAGEWYCQEHWIDPQKKKECDKLPLKVGVILNDIA